MNYLILITRYRCFGWVGVGVVLYVRVFIVLAI